MSLRLAPLVVGLAVCTSCGVSREMQEILAANSQRIRKLERQVEQILPLVSCPQDIRELFSSVGDECRNGICGTVRINAAAAQLDPDRRGKFFEYILEHFVHEVVYIAPNEQEVTNLDRKALFSQMIGYPAFPSTKYLLIASDVRSREDAMQRGNIVKKMLHSLNLPINLAPDIWPYGFKVKPEKLRTKDKPFRLGEPTDISLGIWLFRVDC